MFNPLSSCDAMCGIYIISIGIITHIPEFSRCTTCNIVDISQTKMCARNFCVCAVREIAHDCEIVSASPNFSKGPHIRNTGSCLYH